MSEPEGTAVAPITELVEDGQAFLEQHDLEQVADVVIQAHGDLYTVKDALERCPDAARMIVSMATQLEGVDNGKSILMGTLMGMAASPDAKKKFLEQRS